MSLVKKLWLAVVLIISLIFMTSFVINMMTNIRYLQEQLQIKNNDNAVSLALSISQMEKDPVAIDLMLSAQFDNGHYEFIRLREPSGNLLLEKVGAPRKTNVPNWFKQYFQITATPGIARIQDGWTQYGTLNIASTTDFAYSELWNGTLWGLFWSLIVAIISGFVGSYLLKRIMRPFDEMVEMTEAIGDKNFITIKEPKAYEFKSLAKAMNRLSLRIKIMLQDQSKLLDQMRIDANFDAPTGLMNGRYFSGSAVTHITNQEDFIEGMLILIHINKLAAVNAALGNNETNKVLKQMGVALQDFCNQTSSLIAGRVTGSDFAVLSNKKLNGEATANKIQNLLKNAADLNHKIQDFNFCSTFCKITEAEQLGDLNTLIEAMTTKNKSTKAGYIRAFSEEDIAQYDANSETEWKNKLSDAISNKRLKLAAYPVRGIDGEVIHNETPARLQLTENGQWRPAGEFISWAVQLDLIVELDVLALEKAITMLEQNGTPIGLNLSASAICNPAYLKALKKVLKKHADVTENLWLEVPEYGVFNNLAQFKKFRSLIKPFNCKIGVEHVGAEISQLAELHGLDIDYIKIDASIIRDIDKNAGNQAFLKGICLIAHSIDMIAIAEGVQTKQEIASLKEQDIDAMTGPAIN